MTVRVPIVKIQIVKERTLPYQESVHISSPEEAAQLIRAYLGEADREHFVVLMLSTKHRVNAIHTVSVGSINATIVHPREVLKAAILSNAAAIVVAHNHPSGDPTPSEDDLSVTKRLLQACRIVGIDLLDHVVVCEDRYVSFRERGLFDLVGANDPIKH